MTHSAQKAVHGARRFAAFRRSRASGQSLIVALILLLFLTGIMGTVSLELLTESSISNARHDAVSAFYVARGGLEAGVDQLVKTKSPGYEGLGDAWHSSQNEQLNQTDLGSEGEPVGVFRVSYFDPESGHERIGIADEESKLNINKAEPEMLTRLDSKVFTAEFVKGIVERREKRPFIALEELQSLRGAPRHFATEARESVLTVWGDGKVNINTAPPVVLTSLGMDEEHVKKILEFRKSAGSAGEIGVFKTLGDARSYLGMDDRWFTVSSSYFSIIGQGYLTDKPEVTCKLREVVQRGPDGLRVLRFEQMPFGSEE
jgi:type II secretory pathway component PulK